MAMPRPSLDPIVFRLWQPLHAVSRRPRSVQRLGAADAAWIPVHGVHLHETPTLVLCVAGMIPG